MSARRSGKSRGTAPASVGAVLYLRVSTQRQADEGVSLDAQEARCREHAQRLGLPVVSVHRDEGLSGKDSVEERPGLQAAISDVQAAQGRVLVVYSVSRLARRQKVLWGILDDRDGLGVPLSSATESFDTSTPTGKAMLGMLGVWSQLTGDMISETTREALAYVKAKGKRLGACSMVERIDESGERVVDPERVAVVRRVQALAAEGLSLRAIVERLNREGVPTVRGGGARWHLKTVQTALRFEIVGSAPAVQGRAGF